MSEARLEVSPRHHLGSAFGILLWRLRTLGRDRGRRRCGRLRLDDVGRRRCGRRLVAHGHQLKLETHEHGEEGVQQRHEGPSFQFAEIFKELLKYWSFAGICQ